MWVRRGWYRWFSVDGFGTRWVSSSVYTQKTRCTQSWMMHKVHECHVANVCITECRALCDNVEHNLRHTTACSRPIASRIFAAHCPQKSPIIRGSFLENDLQLEASYGSSLPCITAVLTLENLYAMCCSVLQRVLVCCSVLQRCRNPTP